MSAPPTVTVLMPVCNTDPYVDEAIQSILAQTFRDFELLLLDDGSTDRSGGIVRGYADSRIRLLRNPANLRLIANLNRGLEEARGAYVARMDADDVSLPTRLARQVAFLDRHPEVGVLGSAVQLIDERGTPGAVIRFPSSHQFVRWTLAFQSPIAHPAAMLRRDLVVRLGGYRAEALHCEDYDLWWRLSGVAQLANLDAILLQLRKHGANITAPFATTHRDTAVEICRSALEGLLEDAFPVEVVAAVMNRARAAEAQVPEAVGLLFRYARTCRAAGPLTPDEDAALRRDLAIRVSRWMDDPELPASAWQRLLRTARHARLASTRRLSSAERWVVRASAARRAAHILRNAARHTLQTAYRAVIPWSARAHFTRIYQRNTFGSSESRSGEGSTREQTETIRRQIPALVRELGAKSFLDAPCGDLNWMRHVDLDVERYIGVDIVQHLMAANQARFGGAGREFLCRDLIGDDLPAADIVLCRDCLVHLSFRNARQVLRNFKRSGCRYLLTTTFTEREMNQDLTGNILWRTLNLQCAPFNLPAPLRLINENCTEGGGAYADKSLGLWRLAELPLD